MLLNVSYRTENFKTIFYTLTREQGGMVPGDPCRDQSKNQPPIPALLLIFIIRSGKTKDISWQCWCQILFLMEKSSGCVGAKVSLPKIGKSSDRTF